VVEAHVVEHHLERGDAFRNRPIGNVARLGVDGTRWAAGTQTLTAVACAHLDKSCK
jgi:hypothetical protein